ncbi:MAG TPA: aspartate-semialdehyde dehydrogenase [Thermoplasmata archaeon]|nr:aspartate-semialdehyde dehydrogenase [Thermoplasmata archaeon]
MTEERIPTAILGASGYIGQHFARLLGDHPWFAPPLLVAGPRSEGKRLEEAWQLAEEPPAALAPVRLVRSTPRALAGSGVRVAFSALPSGSAGRFESELVRRGVSVFSNAADHRLDRAGTLLVPEVNGGELRGPRPGRRRARLVTNPNCSAAGLVLALAPVWPLLRPRVVHVATYQAISGAGLPGVPALSLGDNVLPYIAEEEEKIARESTKLLRPWIAMTGGRGAEFYANCARVAVRDGHLEAVTVEARDRPREAELGRAWSQFDPLRALDLPMAPHPPVEVRPESDRPQPVRDRWAGRPPRARGMAAVVGRIRWTPPFLRFFLLSHNAVRGGAGGSVLNAELALARGLLGPPIAAGAG